MEVDANPGASIILAVALISIGLGACALDTPTTAPERTTTSLEDVDPTSTTDILPPTSSTGAFPSEDVEEVARLAISDLEDSAGVRPGSVEVLEASKVTWRDGSLGCPEPGRMYSQALVDGYRIVLIHEGERHFYHAGDDGEPFRCADPDADGHLPSDR